MAIHFQGTAAIIAGSKGIWLQLFYEARENAKIMLGEITSNFWKAMEQDQSIISGNKNTCTPIGVLLTAHNVGFDGIYFYRHYLLIILKTTQSLDLWFCISLQATLSGYLIGEGVGWTVGLG